MCLYLLQLHSIYCSSNRCYVHLSHLSETLSAAWSGPPSPLFSQWRSLSFFFLVLKDASVSPGFSSLLSKTVFSPLLVCLLKVLILSRLEEGYVYIRLCQHEITTTNNTTESSINDKSDLSQFSLFCPVFPQDFKS